MKKLFFIFAVLFFSVQGFAQVQQGQQMINFRGDLGFQLHNTGINYSTYGSRVDWGSLGAEAGLAYYYFLTPHWGLGADISIGDFDGANITFSTHNIVNDQTHLYNVMLAGRYNLNPSSRGRIFIPFGAGLTAARQSLHIDYYGAKFDNKRTNLSPGLYIGAGIEFDIGDNGWGFGLESRYNTFWYATDKLVKNAPAPIHETGKRCYQYMNFLLNIYKRF